MATLKYLNATTPTTTISSPSSVTTFSVSGSGTQSSPYSGASTNQGISSSTANVSFSIAGTGTAEIYYNVNISSEANFDFGRIIKNSVNQLQVSDIGNHIGSFPVSSGDTIQLQYSKDGSVNSNSDVFTINSLYIANPQTIRFLGASTFRFVDPLPPTSTPTINFVSGSYNSFIDAFQYTWTVRNNDATTADVWSAVDNSTPTGNLRNLASTATSSNITGGSVFSSAVIYARAQASGKSMSAVTSLFVEASL